MMMLSPSKLTKDTGERTQSDCKDNVDKDGDTDTNPCKSKDSIGFHKKGHKRTRSGHMIIKGPAKTPSSKTSPNENFAHFEKSIREEFVDLISADIDVMEICDHLYEYGIMSLNTYEEFFKMSCSALDRDMKNNRRRLMIFLSRESFPIERLSDAIARAGWIQFFNGVFNRLDIN